MFDKTKRLALGLAAVAGAAVGGAAIAGAATSHSATTTRAAPPAKTAGPMKPPPGFRNMPAPGSSSHESAEKAVTGDAATKAQEAAVKAAGSGTAGDVTTTFNGDGYEVTVTKTDGTKVEFHLDSSFNVMPAPPEGAPGAPGGFGFRH
jgi:hypothetical protein